MRQSTEEPPGRMDRTAPLSRSFVLRGNRCGVLLIHGFAGSLADLRPFGEALHRRGFTVMGTRLAGHGTSPADLGQTVAEDWIASARTALHDLRERCDAVVILGESMGGLLALRLAREDARVRGVVLFAPPLRLKSETLRRLASRLFPSSVLWKKGWVDAGRAKRGSLRAVTTASYRELLRVVDAERGRLGLVTVPVLAFFSRNDFATDGHSPEILRTSTDGKLARIVIIDESLHHMSEAGNRVAILRDLEHFVSHVTKDFTK